MRNAGLIVAPAAPRAMRLAWIAEPDPRPDQAVVGVHYASLNHGDVNDATSGRLQPGDVLGSDAAGVVLRAAADGSGPEVGARVVGLAEGAFQRRVAIATENLAVVPEDVDLRHAACLPVAGVAALRALRAAGSLLGRTVLVTGASGGVGRYAVQLAARAGATVLASVGTRQRGDGLKEIGADAIFVGLAGVDSVDVVIDSVGGPQMVEAWQLLSRGGSLHSIGWASGEPAVLPPYATVGPAKTLTSYLTLSPVGEDLAILVQLVSSRSLVVEASLEVPLNRFEEAVDALRERRVGGKAIVRVGPRVVESTLIEDVSRTP